MFILKTFRVANIIRTEETTWARPVPHPRHRTPRSPLPREERLFLPTPLLGPPRQVRSAPPSDLLTKTLIVIVFFGTNLFLPPHHSGWAGQSLIGQPYPSFHSTLAAVSSILRKENRWPLHNSIFRHVAVQQYRRGLGSWSFDERSAPRSGGGAPPLGGCGCGSCGHRGSGAPIRDLGHAADSRSFRLRQLRRLEHVQYKLRVSGVVLETESKSSFAKQIRVWLEAICRFINETLKTWWIEINRLLKSYFLPVHVESSENRQFVFFWFVTSKNH